MSIGGHLDREGVTALLNTQPDFRVLGSAGTSGETMKLCLDLCPQVLVLGILDGWPFDVSALQAIRTVTPKTQVLVLAPHSPSHCVHLNPPDPPEFSAGRRAWLARSTCLQDAICRGAQGVVHRDTSPTKLFEAVRTVARGERFAASGIPWEAGGGNPLSPQELRVARLIGRGSSNKEISVSLGISELTVKKHVGNILRRLGLHDRLQLGICVARHPTSFNGG